MFKFNEDNKFNTIETKNITDSKIDSTKSKNNITDSKIYSIKSKKNITDSKKYSIKVKKNKKKQKDITEIVANKDKNKKQKNITEINNVNNDIKIYNFEIEPMKESCRNINSNNGESKNNKTDRESENNRIIENINLIDIFKSIFYCCCKKNRRNIYKILINESMNVVSEKLDIINIFRNICSIEYINYDRNNNLDTIKMTEESSQDLSNIIE